MAAHYYHNEAVRALLVVAALVACGDNAPPPPDTGGDIAAQLAALPGVTVVEKSTSTPGYRFFVLHFTQPVDHADPASATFEQQVSLLHKDVDAPLVVATSGYWDYIGDLRTEPTILLGANQISIEHRFFAKSIPDVAPDWTKLTIAQMAADQHVIVGALRTIYRRRAIATGASKGGMTAIYFRRFYPFDVDGTVAYVAPESFGAPDPRYPPYLDTIGPSGCRQAVRDVATEMLANRRAALEQRAQSEATANYYSYTRIAIGPAVESAVQSLEWEFWQYYGITFCHAVPPVTASDDALYQFLDEISAPSANDDAYVEAFAPYYYQAYFQLGYPAPGAAYLDPYLKYADADYAGMFPTPPPAYDGGAAMRDVDDFVQRDGDRLIFLYGQWDPWSGGAFALGAAKQSLEVVQAQGTHASELRELAPADRDAAFALLAEWTGVAPTVPSAREVVPLPRPPRVPPAIVRAMRAPRR
jgi:hypothetical protein